MALPHSPEPWSRREPRWRQTLRKARSSPSSSRSTSTGCVPALAVRYVPGFGQLRHVRGELPGALEDPLALELEDLGVAV